MSSLSEETVRDAALRLPDKDRARLAADLLDSLSSPTFRSEQEMNEVLARRIAEIDAGRAVLIPSEEAWRLIEADE